MNKETIIQYRKQYYQLNKKSIKEKSKKYYDSKNKDCHPQSTVKHIAQIYNVDSKLSKFQYYNERSIANKGRIEDEGRSIEDNLKSVILYGFISDLFYSYELKEINEPPTYIT